MLCKVYGCHFLSENFFVTCFERSFCEIMRDFFRINISVMSTRITLIILNWSSNHTFWGWYKSEGRNAEVTWGVTGDTWMSLLYLHYDDYVKSHLNDNFYDLALVPLQYYVTMDICNGDLFFLVLHVRHIVIWEQALNLCSAFLQYWKGELGSCILDTWDLPSIFSISLVINIGLSWSKCCCFLYFVPWTQEVFHSNPVIFVPPWSEHLTVVS